MEDDRWFTDFLIDEFVDKECEIEEFNEENGRNPTDDELRKICISLAFDQEEVDYELLWKCWNSCLSHLS